MRSPAVVLLAFVLALAVVVAALPTDKAAKAEAELVAPLTDAAKKDGNNKPEGLYPCRTWCRWEYEEYICTNPCWM